MTSLLASRALHADTAENVLQNFVDTEVQAPIGAETMKIVLLSSKQGLFTWLTAPTSVGITPTAMTRTKPREVRDSDLDRIAGTCFSGNRISKLETTSKPAILQHRAHEVKEASLLRQLRA